MSLGSQIEPENFAICLISGIPTGHDSLETLVRISAGSFLFSHDTAAGKTQPNGDRPIGLKGGFSDSRPRRSQQQMDFPKEFLKF